MKRTARTLSLLALFGAAAPVVAVTAAHAQDELQSPNDDLEAGGGGMKLKMLDEFGKLHCHEDGGTCHT